MNLDKNVISEIKGVSNLNKLIRLDLSYNSIKDLKQLSNMTSLSDIILEGNEISEKDRLKLDVAKSIREDYLQQNGFHEVDTYTSLKKQYKMLSLISFYRAEAERALDAGVYLNDILAMEDLKDRIARSKYIHEDELDKMDQIFTDLKAAIDNLISKGGVANA